MTTSGAPDCGPSRPVIELEFGITVYPARVEHGRWRAVWYEEGERQQCEAATEEKLAGRLERVTERLRADAPNMRRPGAALIAHYLDLDRLPVDARWSRKHAHTQRRLCERFAAPVIDAVTCQDIKTEHTQAIVNAAPTAGEGARVQGMISALVSAGLDGGYLINQRLAKVHWQAGERTLPAPTVTVAGESALWVDRAEIPSHDDISKLGQALGAGRHGERDELMANTAAYSGLRWGELTALTTAQVDQAIRVITVDQQGSRSGRVPVCRGAEEPQAPQDDLPAAHACRLSARRQARRPPRGRPSRTGGRNQPSRPPVPFADGEALAVLQLPAQCPKARVPHRWMARRWRSGRVDMAQPSARVLHHCAVHVEARPEGCVPDGRAHQLPHHA